MKKMVVIIALALAVLVSVPPAEAQAGKIYRIGYLSRVSAESDRERLGAFRQRLRELGYSEGKNIVIEERYAEGVKGRLYVLAKELVRLKVDVIFARSTLPVRAAKRVTKTIPIVMGSVADPLVYGFVDSLARPGGNITGLTNFSSEAITKRLELLKEAVPSASRIVVFLHPELGTHPRQLKILQAVAPGLGVTVVPVAIRELDDFDRAFATVRRERPGGLIILGFSLYAIRIRQIAEFTLKNRLPAIFTGARFSKKEGGLMSYGVNKNKLYRRAADYVDKILRGAKPADLPVERPREFELTINLKTAKKLGITIPPGILLRATKVIK